MSRSPRTGLARAGRSHDRRPPRLARGVDFWYMLCDLWHYWIVRGTWDVTMKGMRDQKSRRNGAPIAMVRELRRAIERGRLTPEQLRQLIALEAQALGLSFEEAVRKARARRLPKTPLGADLELLVQLLPA